MLIHNLLGFTGSYIGGIPFGPLNLSVVEITLKKDRKAAARFAITASLVEIVEASIAILFGKLIIVHLEANIWLKLAVIFFFISFGFFLYSKKKLPVKDDTSKGKSAFVKGLVVSVLNPQAFLIGYFPDICRQLYNIRIK
jgi:threonine/homoserine/homoserine lactone efflux protein